MSEIVGSLPGQGQQAPPQVDPAAVEAGIAATTPPEGPMWVHGALALPLRPEFDLRASIYAKRGDLEAALRVMLADPDRDIDRVLDAGVLTIAALDAAMTVWAETTQGVTPGE